MAVYQATKIAALALPNGCQNLSPEVCILLNIIHIIVRKILILAMCLTCIIVVFYLHVCTVVATIGTV